MMACVREQALIEWQDQRGGRRVLGSLAPFNKGSSKLLLVVDLDGALGVFVRLVLQVSIRVRGRGRRRDLVLVYPLDSLTHASFAFDKLKISQVDSASAIHEAGLSPDGHILRVQFVLNSPGYAVLPNTTADSIVPDTNTAADMLALVRSLCNAFRFQAYIKISDYACAGIEQLAEKLQSGALKPMGWSDMFDNGTRKLDWSCVKLVVAGHGKETSDPKAGRPRSASPRHRNSPPPPYRMSRSATSQTRPAIAGFPVPTDIPPTPSPPSSPSIQVRRSTTPPPPPAQASTATADSPSVIHETPQPPPPLQSALQTLQCGSHSHSDVSTLHLEATSRIRASLAGADTTVIRAHLESIITVWLAKAFSCNRSVYSHRLLRPKLQAMAHHAREADITAFHVARISCAARFFFDPVGVVTEEQVALAHTFVVDMEELLAWMLGEDGDPFADLLAWSQMLELGEAAQAAAAGGIRLVDGASTTDNPRLLFRYNRCKSACVACVLLQYEK